MAFVQSLLTQQPLMTLFLVIALGYLLGEVDIKGFSPGVGAVLFVALAIGWWVPKAAPAPMVGTLGLALFLYAVGVQYGRQFFVGLTSPSGRKANLMAMIGVLLAGAVSLVFVKTMDVRLGDSLGLYAGSSTSAPALQAIIAAMKNDDAAVGYSVAHPFGVAGPILFLYVAFMLLKPKVEMPTSTGAELLEIALHNPELYGKTLADVVATLPEGVQVAAVRRSQRNQPASPNVVMAENDVLLAVGPTREVLAKASESIARAAPGRFIRDRGDMDYLRVFASRKSVVGRRLADIQLPGKMASTILHVRRNDADMLSRPELVVEFGDRVGVLANRSDFPELRKFFGNSIKGTAEFSYISIGVGMALGFLLGAVAFPIPAIGKISLGLAGVLIIALILGQQRRTAGVNWTIPLSANLLLRNLGLTLFLAQVGMASGSRFVSTVSQTGFLMLGLGALVLTALVLPILLLGLFVFRMPFDEVAGIVAGACGNPAILAYSNKLAPTDRPDLGYAMIFPGMTIVKILFVDVVCALFT